MVTHDPDAAAIADRVLFLADGRIVRTWPTRASTRSSPRRRTSAALEHGRAQGPRVPPQPDAPDRDRDRDRRRDGERHLRPDRHHLLGVRLDLPELLREHQRGHLRQERRLGLGPATRPCPASVLPKVRRLSSVQAASGAIFDTNGTTDRAQLLDKQGKAISIGGAPNFGFGFDPTQTRFNPMQLTAGRFATDDEVVIDKGTADKYGYAVGERIGVSAGARRASSRSPGSRSSGPSTRSAARPSRSSPSRRRSG